MTDIEDKIRNAAKLGKIEYAETDSIEDYEEIAREFLRDILGINYDECFISDESCLSDFSSCGLPDDFPEYESLPELYAAWRPFIVVKVKEQYGIDVGYGDYLVDIFEQIRTDRTRMRS